MKMTLEERLDAILSDGQQKQEGLIPLLQKVQGELGYIPEEAIDGISARTGVPASEVFGVLSFYAQFRLEPQGKYVINVCRGTACHVRDGVAIREALERVLGIKAGETTPDMEYTLETVACIGACALAPTIVINDQVHGLMTVKKVEEMFAEYRRDKGD
jgi:NADH:ubiquinone oxidoreductase subunit E